MAGGILSAATQAGVDGFVSSYSSEHKRNSYVSFLSLLIAYVIALVLMGLIGKYLWNAVITDLFTFAKPVKSFWQVVGLMIFVGLMRP
jgi:hypothetical protein